MAQDDELVREARVGRREAFQGLYVRHRDVVARLVQGFGGFDGDEVNDVIQESFIRAFEALHKLRDGAQFRPWLLTIARNRCLSRAVSRGAEQRVRSDLARMPVEPVQPAPVALAAAQEQQIVREIVAALPEGPERTTVELFYIEGEKSLREIAELQGETKSAVAMRLDRFRARVKLQLLARLGADDEGGRS